MTPNSVLLAETARTSQISPPTVNMVPATGALRATGDFGDLGAHRLGHRAAAAAVANAGKKHDLALHHRSQMVLDRGMDIADVEGHRQPAREGIEIAHVDLALPRQFGLPFEAGGKMAREHCDEGEKSEIDDLLRVFDRKL